MRPFVRTPIGFCHLAMNNAAVGCKILCYIGKSVLTLGVLCRIVKRVISQSFVCNVKDAIAVSGRFVLLGFDDVNVILTHQTGIVPRKWPIHWDTYIPITGGSTNGWQMRETGRHRPKKVIF